MLKKAFIVTNNDILRRLRFIENINNFEVASIFKLSHLCVDEGTIHKWLQKDDHPDYLFINDEDFSLFLNGLITKYRGAKEDSPLIPEKKLTNNIVLKKIIIAYSLKSDEVIEILKLADFRIGKSELSAFFRKADHKNYRECKSQILRNFLMGLQIKKSQKEK